VATLGLPGIHVPVLPRQDGEEADSDDQHTPGWLLDLVRDFWNGFVDTDPAWSAASLVVAKRTYDGSCAEQDGLSMPWTGNVWCNPPYSDPAPWADRMMQHCDAAAAHEGLFLVNVSTSVQWFRRARPGAREASCRAVAFFDRRISFIKNGVERKGNDREQMMLWWGDRRRLKTFRRVFSGVAWIAT
jgi:hypothetical protein